MGKLTGNIDSGYTYEYKRSTISVLEEKLKKILTERLLNFLNARHIRLYDVHGWRNSVEGCTEYCATFIFGNNASYRIYLGDYTACVDDLNFRINTIKTLLIAERDRLAYLNKKYANSIHGLKTFTTPEIVDVIFNGPATIVKWSDKTKTVVKCDGDSYDKEKGLAMAISKKFLGSNKSKSNYMDIFKKYCKEDTEEVVYICPECSKNIFVDEDFLVNVLGYMTVKEASSYYNVSESTIRKRCRSGYYNTAVKDSNNRWLIPPLLIKED